MPMISIIIPAWREGDAVSKLVERFDGASGTQVVAALAEDDIETREPESSGAVVARSPKGRARQMNAGAGVAEGDILLFLHADTVIDTASLENVRAALKRPGVVGGAYRLKIDSPSRWLSLVSGVANLRSRLFRAPYGDQAIFVKRSVFHAVGGFDDVPLMEDVRLIQKIRKIGSLAMLDDEAVTSPRRWEEKGYLSNTFRNWLIMAAFKAGVEPEKLADWYYGG